MIVCYGLQATAIWLTGLWWASIWLLPFFDDKSYNCSSQVWWYHRLFYITYSSSVHSLSSSFRNPGYICKNVLKFLLQFTHIFLGKGYNLESINKRTIENLYWHWDKYFIIGKDWTKTVFHKTNIIMYYDIAVSLVMRVQAFVRRFSKST